MLLKSSQGNVPLAFPFGLVNNYCDDILQNIVRIEDPAIITTVIGFNTANYDQSMSCWRDRRGLRYLGFGLLADTSDSIQDAYAGIGITTKRIAEIDSLHVEVLYWFTRTRICYLNLDCRSETALITNGPAKRDVGISPEQRESRTSSITSLIGSIF